MVDGLCFVWLGYRETNPMGKSKKSPGLTTGFIVGFVTTILCNTIVVAGLLLSITGALIGGIPSAAALPPLFWPLAFIGITQALYVAPLYFLMTQVGYTEVGKGVVLGATITLLLNLLLWLTHFI